MSLMFGRSFFSVLFSSCLSFIPVTTSPTRDLYFLQEVELPRSSVQVHDANALPKDHPAFFTGARAAAAKDKAEQAEQQQRQHAEEAQVFHSMSKLVLLQNNLII